MPNDPFCGKGILSEVFLETRHFLAVPNIRPILPGHVVVFPKRHAASLLELDDEEMLDMREMLSRLLPTLLRLYVSGSYNLAVNQGESAGMTIGHLHLHVLPRREGDSFQAAGLRALYTALSKEEGTALEPKGFEAELRRLRKAFRYVQG